MIENPFPQIEALKSLTEEVYMLQEAVRIVEDIWLRANPPTLTISEDLYRRIDQFISKLHQTADDGE